MIIKKITNSLKKLRAEGLTELKAAMLTLEAAFGTDIPTSRPQDRGSSRSGCVPRSHLNSIGGDAGLVRPCVRTQGCNCLPGDQATSDKVSPRQRAG